MSRSPTVEPTGRFAEVPVKRRDVLGLAGLWSAGVAIFGSTLGMLRLPRPRVLPEPSGKSKVGSAAEFPPGTVKVLPDRNIRIESTHEGIVAISLVCTHLGCIVKEEEGEYLCPCHGSRFEPDGDVQGGPAPRGLRWLEISQSADGSLLVDVTREVPLGTYYQV